MGRTVAVAGKPSAAATRRALGRHARRAHALCAELREQAQRLEAAGATPRADAGGAQARRAPWRSTDEHTSGGHLHYLVQDKYRALFFQSPVGVVMYDRDLQIVDCNARLAEIVGASRESVVGLDGRRLRDQRVVPAMEAALRGETAAYDGPYVSTSGSRSAWISLRASPLRGLDGAVAGGIAVVEDVTEQVSAERALQETQQRLRAVIEGAPVGVFALDADGVILLAQGRVFGARELVGRSVFDAYSANPMVLASARRALAGEEFTARESTTDGERWVETHWTPERGEDGARRGVVGVTVDITERVAAEHGLAQSEQRYRSLFEQSPDPVVLLDIEGRIIAVNPASEQLFGRPEHEIIGDHFTPFVYAHDREATLEFFARCVRGETVGFELDLPHESGRVIPAAVRLSPVVIDGRVVGVYAITRDITERRRDEARREAMARELERRVAERTADLRAANRELEAFSYSVSHDLRAPLRSIDGFSQALLEDHAAGLGPAGQDYLRRVRAAAQRMSQLIDAMLALSRVTRSELRPQRVDLSALARAIGEELRAAQPGRDVELKVQDGVAAVGDPQLLRVVLENLLGNAWKFTSHHARARVEFGACERDGERAFFVRDDGAGFDMAFASKLFAAFQRLHGAREFEGTGIGLATIQRIVHRHGGRAWAEGAVEKGATFYFTLPARESACPRAAEA